MKAIPEGHPQQDLGAAWLLILASNPTDGAPPSRRDLGGVWVLSPGAGQAPQVTG